MFIMIVVLFFNAIHLFLEDRFHFNKSFFYYTNKHCTCILLWLSSAFLKVIKAFSTSISLDYDPTDWSIKLFEDLMGIYLLKINLIIIISE